jgi:hypothetical protein
VIAFARFTVSSSLRDSKSSVSYSSSIISSIDEASKLSQSLSSLMLELFPVPNFIGRVATFFADALLKQEYSVRTD